MDWSKLFFGRVTKEEVVEYCVKDSEWQKLRVSMKGKSTAMKYDMLCDYLSKFEVPVPRKVQVQVTNYTTALSRGGLIKPEDYRK